jgi:hypothetical protein
MAAATDSLMAALKTHLDPQFRAPYENAIAKLRSLLTVETFLTIWKDGKQMPLDDVIAFALK